MYRATVGRILLLFTFCLLFLSGCKEQEPNETTPENQSHKEQVIVLNLHDLLNNEGMIQAIEDVKNMEKYSDVHFELVGRDSEYERTMPIMVMSGRQTDIVAVFNPILMETWAEAGVIIPLDPIIRQKNIDYVAEFGPYVEASQYRDQTYMVPHNLTKWVLFYNKKVFDKAGIGYPDAKTPMTWQAYRNLAKALTDGNPEGVYGALHLQWPMYWYGEAIMIMEGGESFYDEEGLSNIEAPAFALSLENTYSMMHLDKSIPKYVDVIVEKIPPQVFFNGNYGMFLQGPWLLNWAIDKERYPRDWDIGIAPMPVDEGSDIKTWGVVGGLAVAKTSANPNLAFQVSMDLTRLCAKYTKSEPQAIQTVEQALLFESIGSQLSDEGLTAEALNFYFMSDEMIFLTEKVTGPNSAKYEDVINQQVEEYLTNSQDLETTIANIKAFGDLVITE